MNQQHPVLFHPVKTVQIIRLLSCNYSVVIPDFIKQLFVIHWTIDNIRDLDVEKDCHIKICVCMCALCHMS